MMKVLSPRDQETSETTLASVVYSMDLAISLAFSESLAYFSSRYIFISGVEGSCLASTISMSLGSPRVTSNSIRPA